MTQGIIPMSGFTVGCDPELFIMNETGKYVSAAGLIPGTKAKPYKVPGGAVQVDGMAAEFNTDPAETFEEFDANIVKVLKSLGKMLPPGHSLSAVPAVTFDQDVWDAAPEEAKELGCSPDFNAWTGDANPPPLCKSAPTLRTASGHLHVGWTNDADFSDMTHILNCQDLVKQLDWFLGGWSLKKDTDATRRNLYGKAGACRYKSYGVEYRVLSNFWVTSKANRLAVWNRLNTAIHQMRDNFLPEKYAAHGLNDKLIESINESKPDKYLWSNFQFPLLSL